ncbi:hypothetical protein A2U01_0113480, partial [Trifolium medium]|nr:hypothetical protein [Trifolium medium]
SLRVAQHYPARSAGTINQNALCRAALRATQITPARCAATRSKTTLSSSRL